MAAIVHFVPVFSSLFPPPPSSSPSSSFSHLALLQLGENGRNLNSQARVRWMARSKLRAMAQETLQGSSATYAKEMERLSAKESLLLAFKDSGGLESLITGKTTDIQRIDVNERITCLERLNPTSRPQQGLWNFQWCGAGNPSLLAANLLFQRFPSSLAYLLGLDVVIKDGYAQATANLRFFNVIESKFTLTSKLLVEGPLRMKEEFVEGIFEVPIIKEEAIPEQLKDALGQVSGTLQQVSVPVKDMLANGLKVPLSGTFQRMFMISYLDEEILIIRDTAGVPDVLTRLDESSSSTSVEPILEYES